MNYKVPNVNMNSFFSIFRGSLFIQAKILKTNPFKLTRIFNAQNEVITYKRWHHVCITRSSAFGNWGFYTNGAKKEEGVGLGSDYSTDTGFLIVGMFKGVLTRFNMWDEYIDDLSRIEKISYACSSLTGNVVPWPEVQLWRNGNVIKMNCSLCKFPGEISLNEI